MKRNMKRKSVTLMTIFIIILTMIVTAAPQIPGMDIIIPDIPILIIAPSNLKAEATGDKEITLTWDDNNNGESGFKIFRKESSEYVEIGIAPANTGDTAIYVDTDSLERGKEYSYKVKVYKGNDESGFSNEAKATTYKLLPPSDFKVISKSDTSIIVEWKDNCEIEDFYKVCKMGEGPINVVCYEIKADSEKFCIEGLKPNTNYIINVSTKVGNNEALSPNITIKTLSKSSLEKPTRIKAEPKSQTQILVSWQGNSIDAKGYIVERKEKGERYFTEIKMLEGSIGSFSFNDNTVEANKKYTYRIQAFKGKEHIHSGEVTVIANKPYPPKITSGIRVNDNETKISWVMTGEFLGSYVIEKRVGTASFEYLAKVGNSFTDYTDNAAPVGEDYAYRLYASNGSINSVYSNSFAVKNVITPVEPEEPETPDEPPIPVDEPEPIEPETPEDTVGGSGGAGGGGSGGTGGTGGGGGTGGSGTDAGGDSPAEDLTALFDKTEGDWAVDEIKAAYMYGLTYPDIMNSYKKSITREELCKIVVKLYEKLSGKAATAEGNPFTDTNDPEIIKANRLGIVLGIGNNLFAPERNITRQEICVMIKRALEAALGSISNNKEVELDFIDKNKIGDWAIDAMKFCYKNNIMKGISENEIAPLNNTTREQAVVLLKRTYEGFKY